MVRSSLIKNQLFYKKSGWFKFIPSIWIFTGITFYQVVILLHNLKIVDYVIGLPGSMHDASTFGHTCVACHPDQFFAANEWLWADSAYFSQTWCVTPFKNLLEEVLVLISENPIIIYHQ